MGKFVILDASSLIYRSFYAIKKLSTKEGFPTNAIYGFLSTLRKIINEVKPDFICIAMDAGGKTVRHEAYEKYKSERRPMPDDLQIQIPWIKRIITAYKIPFVEIPSYEADDVIGSIAEKAKMEGFEVIIATTDKDLFQIVKDGIKIYNPAKDIYLDEEGVEKFFGVKPSQVVDVLSLWGDPTDNVPGVPGIGEKGAKELIKEFGSLENLLKNLENVKERYRELIKANLETLLLSRELVKVKTDLDIGINPSDFKLREGDIDELRKIFEELQFSSLLKELPFVETIEKEYRTIHDWEELIKVFAEIKDKKRVSIRVGISGKSPVGAEIEGVAFSIEANKAFYLPLGNKLNDSFNFERSKAFEIVREIFEDESIAIIGHDIKFDYIILKNYGIGIKNIQDDSMILSHLLDPNRKSYSLEELAMEYLSYRTKNYRETGDRKENSAKIVITDVEEKGKYYCEASDTALILTEKLRKKVKEENLERVYIDFELPFIEILAEMQFAGVKVDTNYISGFSKYLEREIGEISQKIYKSAGVEFNINSPKQVAEILFEKLNLPTIKKTYKSKDLSVDSEVLMELYSAHPIIPLILEYRTISKLKSTYCDSIYSFINPKTGRLHTSFNQAGTATGRISSSEPNLQNIPVKTTLGRKVRRAFISEEGFSLLSADYSQIDLRVLAHFSEDPVLVSAFCRGEDIHERTAVEVFSEELLFSSEERRRRAKIINFSIIYGTSPPSLSKELGVPVQKAKEFIERYFRRYKNVREFIENTINEAREKGYVRTISGRKRQIPELKSSNKGIRNSGERIAINSVIQGSTADLMKKGMIEVWNFIKRENLRSRLILQIHDEIILECPDEELEFVKNGVKNILEKVFLLKVPLKVNLSSGKNWEEV